MALRLLSTAVMTLCITITNAQVSKKHLKILNSTQRAWSPGMVRENSSPAGGHLYEVSIKVRKKGNFEIERLIAANESLEVELIEAKEGASDQLLKKCSKWTLVARSNNNRVQGISDDIMTMIKQNPEVEGWVLYRFNSKEYLTPINKFEPTIAKVENP